MGSYKGRENNTLFTLGFVEKRNFYNFRYTYAMDGYK